MWHYFAYTADSQGYGGVSLSRQRNKKRIGDNKYCVFAITINAQREISINVSHLNVKLSKL